jgi:ESCRT-I complex subunit VPS37
MYSNFQAPEPDLAPAMGLLTHLNIEELKEILNDDSKFENMIKDVKQASTV